MAVFTKTFVTFFQNAGVPATGLSPTIDIRRTDTGALVVTAAAMTELGDGWYKYDYASYDDSLEYVARFDGTVVLPITDQFQFGASVSEDRRTIQNQILSDGTPFSGADVVDMSTDMALVLGLVQHNHYMDNTSYNAEGLLLAGRIRLFTSKTDTDNATDGGTGEGEFAIYLITTVPNGSDPSKVETFKVTKEP